MNKTRLFYVVDSVKDNEEIFATLEGAEKFYNAILKKNKPRLCIAMVKNAYFDKSCNSWNYEDYSDTFRFVKKLE